MNRATGKMEQHTGTHKTPIFGKIQNVFIYLDFFNFFSLPQVDTVYNHQKRDYDFETKRWGNTETTTETQ